MKKIFFLDKEYPELLRQIADSPNLLYCRGDIEILNRSAIAVVGTRRMTDYGRLMTEKLTGDLVKAGFVIVSGMARGIDAVAHRTAIENNGKTIAVLGCGLDIVYPPENRDIYERADLVISEFPEGTKPLAKNFPKRNRIISGLSEGVLVIEAARKSGTMITARMAAEQGREVFAVVGPANCPMSEGTSWLIQQGAKLVRRVEDILEEF